MGVVAPTAPDQRAALVDLYIATNGSTWSINTGWRDYASGSDPCDNLNSWFGVTCDGFSGFPNRNVTYVDCAVLPTGWWLYDECLLLCVVLVGYRSCFSNVDRSRRVLVGCDWDL